jgi:hypothetical protein
MIFDSQTLGLTPELGDFIVNSGGTLCATGLVNRIQVNPGGTLSPGLFSGTGALRPQRGLSFSPGSSLLIDLNGVTPSLDFDSMLVTGAVNLSNATLLVTIGYDAVINSEYQIISNDGTDPVAGTFAGLPEGAILMLTNGCVRVTYVGGDGNDVMLTKIADIPEIETFSRLPGGAMHIVAHGEPVWFALIEATSSLSPPISWELIDVQISDLNGLIDFIDSYATNHPVRFYRIGAP